MFTHSYVTMVTHSYIAMFKERVFMSEAQRNDSWQKYGSFEGGTPGGQMCKTHTKLIFFLSFSLYSHQFRPVESF